MADVHTDLLTQVDTNGTEKFNNISNEESSKILDHENGVETNDSKQISTDNSNLPLQKKTKRPTGIPKLNSTRPIHSEAGTYKTSSKLPLSPELVRPSSTSTYSKSPSPDPNSLTIEKLLSPTYNKRSRNFNYQNSAKPRSAVAQSLNRYDRAMSEEHQLRTQCSQNSNYSERGNSATGGVITSKIGSLQNAKYKPGGGNVQIYAKKVDFSHVEAKCGSTKNVKHQPGGGNVKIVEKKIDLSNVSAKCGSTKNLKHQPKGGDVKIFNQKLDFKEKVAPKVKSLANVEHKPTGGDVKIASRKLDWKVDSKVGSLNNVKHRPAGGNVKIVTEQLPWLKHNKPNLPPEEIAKINKRSSMIKDGTVSPCGTIGTCTRSYSNSICSERSN